MRKLTIFFWVASTAMVTVSCKKEPVPVIQPPLVENPLPVLPTSQNRENDPVNFGNPTKAQTLFSFTGNYLMDQSFYKIAYSSIRNIPLWVAWHFQSENIGGTPRQDDFRPDEALPAPWYKVQSNSFSGSGFDRGHNCPSGDRTASIAQNSSTFLMTNIIPQAPKMNQGAWEGLETFMRNSLAGNNNEVYVVMGNYGIGGYNSNGTLYNNINNGYVTVPARIWKVILVLPKGANDLHRITRNSTILAVDMPNDNRVFTSTQSNLWRNYITNVYNIERAANAAGVPLLLFQNMADSLQPILKAAVFQ